MSLGQTATGADLKLANIQMRALKTEVIMTVPLEYIDHKNSRTYVHKKSTYHILITSLDLAPKGETPYNLLHVILIVIDYIIKG